MTTSRSYKIAIIAPTCFYYQVPLFCSLAADSRLDITVYFCSDEGILGKDVKSAYGAEKSWGVEEELLKGYKSKLLKNHSPRGSYLKSLIGLANLGIWDELKNERPDVVVVMSWMNPTWWLVFLACLRLEIPLFLMTDANVTAEQSKSSWKSWLKRALLGRFLFPITAGFLCSGAANRMLYSYYGVPETKLIPFAYSWGYSSLIEQSDQLEHQKTELRKQYGLPDDAFVILYCGRLSPEKGTIDLIEAYSSLPHPNKTLIYVGDGRTRDRIQQSVADNSIESVYFMEFQDRKNIGNFYTLADLLVLPSHRETWGIVVNEALCFSLPVVVSDQVGAGADLVIPGENGLIFPAGNVEAMAHQISVMIEIPEEERLAMGRKSKEIIKEWSQRNLADPLSDYLDQIYLTRT